MRRLKYYRMRQAELRAARANRVFCTDEKRIRTENTVMDKNKDSVGVLLEIADWAWMCFSSMPDRRSARTDSRPRNIASLQQRKSDSSRQVKDHYSMTDLQGLSAYQNIQGAMRADFVDSPAGLG